MKSTLASALEGVHAFFAAIHSIAVEIGGGAGSNSVKSSIVFSARWSRRAAECRRRGATASDAVAELLRAGIGGQVRPCVLVAFEWQSKQAAADAGNRERRSSVALNCCCGKGVNNTRSPSRCLGVSIPFEHLVVIRERDQLTLRDIAQNQGAAVSRWLAELGQK